MANDYEDALDDEPGIQTARAAVGEDWLRKAFHTLISTPFELRGPLPCPKSPDRPGDWICPVCGMRDLSAQAHTNPAVVIKRIKARGPRPAETERRDRRGRVIRSAKPARPAEPAHVITETAGDCLALT